MKSSHLIIILILVGVLIALYLWSRKATAQDPDPDPGPLCPEPREGANYIEIEKYYPEMDQIDFYYKSQISGSIVKSGFPYSQYQFYIGNLLQIGYINDIQRNCFENQVLALDIGG